MTAEDDLMGRADRWAEHRPDQRDRYDMALHIAAGRKVVRALIDRVDALEVELDEERSGVWP